MNLSKRAFGMACGFFAGLFILITTYLILILDGAGGLAERLEFFLKGYSVSWGGGIIGFVWGFILGFGFGFSFAFIYNITLNFIKKFGYK